MKDYEPIVLKRFCDFIHGVEGSEEWLKKSGARELVEFWDAYINNIEKSFQWLKNNGFIHFSALVDAMNGNEKAKVWLAQNDCRVLVALVDASDGNKTAVLWMLKMGEKGWLAVAKEIYDYHKKKDKRSFGGLFNLGNPFA
jgi:hypothetical protein